MYFFQIIKINSIIKISKLLFAFVVLLSFVYIIGHKVNDSGYSKENFDRLDSLSKKICFKGKIINAKIIERYVNRYYLLCIKLDYTNINEYYIFKEKLCALKIKNGIGVLVGGLVFNDNKIPTYIEYNIDNCL